MVDDEDYEFLMTVGSWYAGERYPQIINKKVKPNKTVLMHRVLASRWNLEVPAGMMIDHKDGNGFNNQRSNIRIATPHDNVGNSAPRKHRRFKGPHFDPRTGRYQSFIRHNNRLLHLGMYASEEEAAAAYNTKAKEIFGEFARLNII
jgi:hypothetical protein